MLTGEGSLSKMFVLYFEDWCDELTKYMMSIINPAFFPANTENN